MNFAMTWRAAGALALLALAAAVAVAAEEPIVTRVTLTTKDAPRLKTVDHGRIGQNVMVDWWTVAPGRGGDAVYAAAHPIRTEDDGAPQNSPVFFRVDLADGKLTEYFPKGETVVKQAVKLEDLVGEREDMGGLLHEAGKAPTFYKGFPWGAPRGLTIGPDGKIYALADAGHTGRVVRLDPATDLFQEYLDLGDDAPAAVAFAGRDDCRVLCVNRKVYRYSQGKKLLVGTAPIKAGPVAGLAVDARGVVYTAVGPAPWTLYALAGSGAMQMRQLLPEIEIAAVRFDRDADGPLCEVTTGPKAAREVRRFRLHAGKASPLPPVPPPAYTLTVDFRTDPAIVVHQPDKPDRPIRLVFTKAEWGRVKSIVVGPDGRKVYGGAWPTAWIYEFDPDTGRIRRPGADYVWYEVKPYDGKLWIISYYGIRMMRWDPTQPWTYDMGKDYNNKKPYPLHQSPWGLKDSNPRLICMFRILRNLNIRRPAGFAIGGDGRIYSGSKNPGVLFYVDGPPFSFDGYRYSGALCWYDPKTETVGQERAPYLHHEMTDICRVGKDFIATVDKARPCPYEPLPEPYAQGRLILFDLRTHTFVDESEPTGGKVWYVDEGAPGQIVGFASPGRYGGDGVRSVLFVYDVAARRTTRIIRLSLGLNWGQYDHCGKFERGPDHKVYFYGHDDAGHALFRVDSETGVVEPVLNEPGVTDFRMYSHPGAAFCFGRDRIYFGTHGVRSLPLTAIGCVAKKEDDR